MRLPKQSRARLASKEAAPETIETVKRASQQKKKLNRLNK